MRAKDDIRFHLATTDKDELSTLLLDNKALPRHGRAFRLAGYGAAARDAIIGASRALNLVDVDIRR